MNVRAILADRLAALVARLRAELDGHNDKMIGPADDGNRNVIPIRPPDVARLPDGWKSGDPLVIAWPALLAWPLTAGDTLAVVVGEHGSAMLDELAADVERVADAFKVDACEAAKRWPWWSDGAGKASPNAQAAQMPKGWHPSPEAHAAGYALGLLRRAAPAAVLAGDWEGGLPDGAPAATVAAWAGPVLDTLIPVRDPSPATVRHLERWGDPEGRDRTVAELVAALQSPRPSARIRRDVGMMWIIASADVPPFALGALYLAAIATPAGKEQAARRVLRTWTPADPDKRHFDVARTELEHAKHPGDDSKARLDLAGAVLDELRTLAAALDVDNGPLADDANGEAARDALAERLRTIGDKGRTLADDPKLTADDPWRYWLAEPPICVDWLARALWHDKVRPETVAKPARALGARVGGDRYVKLPKLAHGVGWALGAPGVQVEIDGDRYAQAPGLTFYVSRSAGLLPKGAQLASQLSLDVGVLGDDVPLAVRVVGDAQAVVSAVAAKAGLWMMATAPAGAGLTSCTLRDFTKALRPGYKRIQARDYQDTARAFRVWRGLTIVMPDDTDVTLFDIRAPRLAETADPDQQLWWGWTQSAALVANEGAGLSALTGWFLLNLDGAMRLDARHPIDLRTYLYAMTLTNDVRRRPDRVPELTIPQLAAQVNALSEQAVQYRAGQGKNRRAASEGQRQTKDSLERLSQEAGLLDVEWIGKGRHRRFKLLPPKALLEAWQQFRAGPVDKAPRRRRGKATK